MSLHGLAVGQGQYAFSLFVVVEEVALEGGPFAADVPQVAVVVLAHDVLRLCVVEDASAVETSMHPLALVIRLALGVVEHTLAVHVVLLPLAAVDDAVRVDQFAVAVFQRMKKLALVVAAVLGCGGCVVGQRLGSQAGLL